MLLSDIIEHMSITGNTYIRKGDNMVKVIDEFSFRQYKVLKLDTMDVPKAYTKYVIDGKTYDIVPVYDLPGCIAIVSEDSFVGKMVEFK